MRSASSAGYVRDIDILRGLTLAAQTGRDTALIYLSDHGESLGENGLYLHGVPYAIAPQTQTRVPMVMWLSSGFAASRGVDVQCMKREAREQASQDNLFHSVLGLMQVSTPEYDGRLDLFRGCSSGAAAAARAEAAARRGSERSVVGLGGIRSLSCGRPPRSRAP